MKQNKILLLIALGTGFALQAGAEFSSADFDPKKASFDELLFHAQRFGNTSNKIVMKSKCSGELMARRADSLQFLMQNIHLDNITVQVLAFNLVEALPATNAVPVLVPFIQDSHSMTRKLAVFFLGFYNVPEQASQVLPLLNDVDAAGAAMRTLGKWRIRQAATNIVPFLAHEREVRRVAAANALRDIGDPVAIPALLQALNDPVFTVREASARALSRLGPVAEKALIRALPKSVEPSRRQIVRTLGAMKSRRAAKGLKQLTRSADPWVRCDAREALRQIRRD
ncbi:MAG: hypothetical protein A2X46_04815 [Lentisphaerae bacterium GWF2_57_35]|nr:MAG: hypothetical protein A2X46_04815 [Lentisphaerae bacterium GWF2_57_35]